MSFQKPPVDPREALATLGMVILFLAGFVAGCIWNAGNALLTGVIR